MPKIKNARIFNGESFVPVSALRYENGVIAEMYESCDDADALDAQGQILCPGFVDLHIHGSFGKDVLEPGGTAHLRENLPSVGTTSFCPTNATDTFEHIHSFLREVAEEMPRQEGSRILGAHIEGPFFALDNRGAHAIPLLQDPTLQNYKKMAGEYEGVIVRVSLAPEKRGGMELISYLAQKGVVVSAAHTDSMAKEMEEAISKGISIATHTLNGFYPVHHRQENSIAVVLTDDRIICEFIPDLQHINVYAARLIMKAKGFEKTFICSDALEPSQQGDGIYSLAGSKVIVRDSVARLEDGRLAGSTICILQGVRNLVNIMKIPLCKALRLGTYNPANAIGNSSIGRIAVGAQADFLLLSEDLQLMQTYIRGKLEYSRA